MFQYSFGKDSNVLGNLENAASLRRNLNQLLQGVKATKHFHSFFRIIKTMPISLSRWLIPPGAKNMRDLTMVRLSDATSVEYRFLMHSSDKAIRSEIKDVLDNKANERKPRQRSIFYDLCDDPNLPSAEKQPERLQQEGTMLVMAGICCACSSSGPPIETDRQISSNRCNSQGNRHLPFPPPRQSADDVEAPCRAQHPRPRCLRLPTPTTGLSVRGV